MSGADHSARRALDGVVRRERGRLIAGLVARLGPTRLDLADDVAQEAMLAALDVWAYQGLPRNPAAWLATVARRKAIDRLRRTGRETVYDAEADPRAAAAAEGLLSADVADPELRLVVLACDPRLGVGERLALTLQLAGGFSAREIAAAFLAEEAAIGQRLVRAKRKLRALGVAEAPDRFALRGRMGAVRRALHLLFGLGYAPRTGARLVRDEICHEALRLAELASIQAAEEPGAAAEGRALAALMCFHTARLPARTDPDGGPVLLRDQDRRAWDQALIARGFAHLAAAHVGERPSAYHLEAAIAGAHAASRSWEQTDWRGIHTLYGALQASTGSAVAAVNGAVAQALAGDAAGALERLERLAEDPALARYPMVHAARGEALAALGRTEAADAARAQAAAGALSTPARLFFAARIGAANSLLEG